MPTQGIDVSSNNPHPIDWAAVKKSGRSFVIVKLTEGGGSTAYVNPYAKQDIIDAKAAGLEVAGYHFVHPTVPVAEQVALIREHLDPGSPSSLGIVFVDSETAEGTWGKTAEVTHAMLNELEKYVKTGLYSNLDFLENMDGAPWGYPLWLAHYSPTSGHAFTLWQFTNAGGCHGVVGAVDINLWPGTEEDLHHLFTHK